MPWFLTTFFSDMFEQNGYMLKWPCLVCLYIGLFLHSVVSQTHIPLGSKLSVSDNNFWVSPNGEFAFGFFNSSDRPDQYSVGIRFNSDSIPAEKRAVVWVLGADIAVGNGSYLELSAGGEMALFDSSKGANVWTTETYGILVSVESAALFDNGNFALMSESKDVVWQSFDYPSDTLVPGQNFSALHTLRAASKNSVSSYYSLFMNASGRLQLRWDSSVVYWASGGPPGANFSAFVTPGGALQVRNAQWEPVWSVFGDDHDDSVPYRFLRLDADGNLRLYSWLQASGKWEAVWRAVENQCGVFATCEKQGVCVNDELGTHGCECPFDRANATDSSCLIPFPKRCGMGYYMLNYQHMALYAVYPPNNYSVSQISLRDCEHLCLKDPLCTSATFTNDGTARCLLQKTQYVSGYSDPSLSSVSFVKRCADPMAVNPHQEASGEGSRRGGFEFCFPCVMGAISGTSVLFIAVQLAALLFIYRRRRRSLVKRAVSGHFGANSNGLIAFSFLEIKDLTGNFENRIGPTMFKGVLHQNLPVAVKEIRLITEERKFRVFASKIGSIHHKNLARLEGYCCELSHRFLIYEYAENGSLDKYLEDPKLCKKLNWAKRVEICLSVARAVCYLHTGCREFVSHGNLKCENVVLDENLEAKVSEFGLHRVANEAPASSLAFSAEKDVEDFGRMVLVLVSGCSDREDLLQWTYKEWMEGNAANVVDKRIGGVVGPGELDRALRIAFWCLQWDERMRPAMREVVKVLEGTLSVDPPPPPFAPPGRTEEEDDEGRDGLSDAASEPDPGRF